MNDLNLVLRHERDEVTRCEPHSLELYAVVFGLPISLSGVFVLGGGVAAGYFDESFDDSFE